MIHKVLIAIDDTVSALNTADYGIDLAKKINAKIAVVYVTEPLTSSVDGGAMLREAEKALHRRHGNLMDEIDITHPDVDIKEFDPIGKRETEIRNTIERWKPDLLVIGYHSHSLIQRIFGHNVEKHLIGQIKIPLLIVPNDSSF